MQYIIASLVALAATVAASPVGQLEARQTACYIPPTAPVTAGSTTVTLTGPFKLKSSSTSTNPKASGKYAHYKQYIPGGDNTGTTDNNLEFGATTSFAAQKLYLNPNNYLVSIVNDTIYHAQLVPYAPQPKNPEVKLREAISYPLVHCVQDTTTCALNCDVNGMTYNSFSSVSYQPDWVIGTSASTVGKGNVPFTPIVVQN